MPEPWHFEKIKLKSGITLRVARAGSGRNPPIVMLHGFPECWYSWRHQMRALSDRFDCVAPEMRGYGESDAPVGVANCTLDKLVGDVSDLIEALGHERATVVGHDWGGAVAWATAMMRPGVVERLIVMNCPHLERMSRALRRNPRQMLRSWYMLFFQIPRVLEWALRRRNYEALVTALRDSTIQKDVFTDADLDYFRAAFRNPYSITAAINYYRANFRSGFMAGPGAGFWIDRKISAPTLLIWGEQDFALGKELTYGMEPLFSGPFEIKIHSRFRPLGAAGKAGPGESVRPRFPRSPSACVGSSDLISTPTLLCFAPRLSFTSGSKRLGRSLSLRSRSHRRVVCLGASRQIQKEGLLCPLSCM